MREKDNEKDFSSVRIDFPGDEPAGERMTERFFPRSGKPNRKLISEYEPSSSLIKHVKITAEEYNYSFCENFYKDAKKYYGLHGQKSDYVPYSAFFPQYSSMSREQFNYYLYWRDQIRAGGAVKAGESYILLFIYELCNLSLDLAPEEVLLMLNAVYNNYSASDNVAKVCATVIRDFTLIHGMPQPASVVPFIKILDKVPRPEFFFSGKNAEPVSVLYLTASYLFGCEKAKEKYPEEYIKHITGAFIYAYPALCDSIRQPLVTAVKSDFEGYRGIICTSGVKRKIEIEYISPVFNDKIREKVSALSKYIDNKFRAHYGISGRMRADGIPAEAAAAADAYFKSLPPRKPASEKKKPETREYDILYEPENTGFSPERAARLEKESWTATEILTADGDTTENTPGDKGQSEKEENTDPFTAAFGALYENNYAEFQNILRKTGILEETFAETINSRAFELFNDAIVEQKGEKYVIIEEYVNEAAKLLK